MRDEKAATDPAATKNPVNALQPDEVGYYMDVLTGRLRQVAGAGVGLSRRADRLVLAFAGRFIDDAGRAQADAGTQAQLAPLAQVLAEYRKVRIAVRIGDGANDTIDGRADTAPCAAAIAQGLRQAGVAAARVETRPGGAHDCARIELELAPILRTP